MVARTNNGSVHHHTEPDSAVDPIERTRRRWIRGVSITSEIAATLVLLSVFLVGAFTVLRAVWRFLFTG